MVDILAIRQSYERRLITEVKLIDGNSDAMTKEKPNNCLSMLIDENRIKIKEQQWVEREVGEGQKE